MNPSLVKFMVDLQNEQKVEAKNEDKSYKNISCLNLFKVMKPVKVTVPIKKD